MAPQYFTLAHAKSWQLLVFQLLHSLSIITALIVKAFLIMGYWLEWMSIGIANLQFIISVEVKSCPNAKRWLRFCKRSLLSRLSVIPDTRVSPTTSLLTRNGKHND